MKFFYRIKIKEVSFQVTLEELSPILADECQKIADELKMDDDRLLKYRQLLEEACVNAIKHGYNGKPGLVTLRFYLYKDTLITEVKDNGKGFNSEEEFDKLLTRRLELNTSTKKAGLLVLLKSSDDLEIESSEEAGTLVRIYYNLLSEKTA